MSATRGSSGGGAARTPLSPPPPLPPDSPDAWQDQLAAWQLEGPLCWAVSGVHPQRRDALAAWAKTRGDTVWLIDRAGQLPLRVNLDQPDWVGIDRLLKAVAANDRVRRAESKIIIDTGTAVTVDWVDETGAFRGGAIFPGLRTMSRALHDQTALVPLVEVPEGPNPPLPGTSTPAAVQAGIFWAVAGGIKALVRQLSARSASPYRQIFLTGGDAALLAPVMDSDFVVWPFMTLEGIRLAALEPSRATR